MNLTAICIKKPVFAWMLLAGTVVFGLVAAARIGISQFPDVDFPTLSIDVTWEGAAPEAIEHDVVELIEEAVVQVEGVRSLNSSSRQGGANITVELDISRNIDLALQDVQAKIAQVQRRLPQDIDPPVISKTNPEDQPIMWVGISGPFSPQVLSDYARYRLKEKLQTVAGVGEITLGGFLERNIRIWLDASRLDARGLTVTDVIDALHREHLELPAGQIEAEGREVNVRVLGEALDLRTFRSIVVGQVSGAPVYLEDVGLVEDGFEDVRRLARVGGVPAQGLGIKKQRGANAVAVAQGVRTALDGLRPSLPEGMELGINFDSTKFIEESVHEVEFELLMAVLLTAVVCWMFLASFSNALNVILAIPMSLLGTVATIYFLGYTLNTFTLLALSLSVGIVVDDAIMVMENIFRHAQGGKERIRAAGEGADEIKFAALAATLAVVAIFIPVVFMEGVVGRFFLQFGVTLSIAVLLSYVEAITLAPARASQLLSFARKGEGRLGHAVDRIFEALRTRYGRVLALALRWPVAVLCLAAVLFFGSFMALGRMPKEFVPSQDQSRLLIRFQTAVGSTLHETDQIMQRAEAFINARPEAARVFTVVGGVGGTGVNTGLMFVTLVPPGERKASQAEFAQLVRKEFNAYPGLRAVIQDLSQSGFTARRGFPVEFSILGSDWEELIQVSQEVMSKLRASGLVIDLDSDYLVGMPELRIYPDRARAADLGVSVEKVAQTLNAMVGGLRVGKYSTGGRRIDVRVRLLAEQRTRPEDINRLQVRSASDRLLPLASLVTYEERAALQSITRRDRERAITVFANVAPGHSQDEALRFVEGISKGFPVGYHLVLGGASVAFRESTGSLLFALFLGIAVSYMVLASQFNSFLHPVTVLTILPISVAGAFLALWLFGASLNIFSMIGLLLLMGIVKKNSIILVDYANQTRGEKKFDAREAMLHAGPVRLRPILMTSICTFMAAFPIALALGPGAEIRSPMAIAVIGGLVVSTALSLLVVPAFYVLADRAAVKIKGLLSWRRSETPAKGESALTPPEPGK
jgi:hydrophobe/amphiphile efflux-1 (HAE1) family protein